MGKVKKCNNLKKTKRFKCLKHENIAFFYLSKPIEAHRKRVIGYKKCKILKKIKLKIPP